MIYNIIFCNSIISIFTTNYIDMDLSKELQKIYTIVYDLASNVKESPECFHDSFDIEIVDDCENIMDILNNIFKFYKI